MTRAEGGSEEDWVISSCGLLVTGKLLSGPDFETHASTEVERLGIGKKELYCIQRGVDRNTDDQ